MVVKYKINPIQVEAVQFFKHRPDNFPTIRLAQLCMLYHVHRNLFSKIIEAKSVDVIYQLFDVAVSPYWKTHYTFEKTSPKKEKFLTPSFINLIIINTIVPIKFAYTKSQGKDDSEQWIGLLTQLKPEKNSVIEKFAFFKIEAENAFQSQALLQLKNEYCDAKRCLQCAVGLELLKN